jgi:hypothetical protein
VPGPYCDHYLSGAILNEPAGVDTPAVGAVAQCTPWRYSTPRNLEVHTRYASRRTRARPARTAGPVRSRCCVTARQFVSYPKSGRSWIRFILSQLNCDQLIVFHHDRFEFSDGSKPPHSFSVSNRLAQYAETEKLVYLDRDPHDVMVSLYHQITGRFGDVFNYQGNISEFVRDEYFGAVNLRKFRDMWGTILSCRKFLKISYEACHRDMNDVLQRLLTYYEIEVPQAQLLEAIDKGSLTNMKKVEASDQFAEPWLRYRNGSPKVRQGKIGGFRDVLTRTDIAFLDEIFYL